MMNKKRGWILALCLVFLVSLVYAEEGCYTYKNSPLYCFNMEETAAFEECLSYEECNFEQAFFSGEDCEEVIGFPDCKEVLCKSTCDYDFLGRCSGGEVPPGGEEEWCMGGCCRFDFSGGNFCEFKDKKWSCEVEASNKGAIGINFDNLIGEQACQESCNQVLLLGESNTEGLLVEDIGEVLPGLDLGDMTPEEVFQEELSEELTTVPDETMVDSEGESEDSEEMELETGESAGDKKEKPLWPWVVSFVLLAGAIFYLFWKYGPQRREREEERKPRRFFFRRSEEIKTEKSRGLGWKVREKERREMFNLFGFGEIKEKKRTYVDLLEKIARVTELKKGRGMGRGEKVFKEVEGLVEGLKEEGKKIGELTEREARDIFERLKELVEGKK